MTSPDHDVTSEELELVALRLSEPGLQIRPAPVDRSWMESPNARFAKRCLPLLIANQSGWELLNPAGFSAIWDGGDEISAIRIWPDFAQQAAGVISHFGCGILTWHVPIHFRSPRGYNLLVRGPANMPKDGISALEGVVETDWSSATFTMNWKFTRAGHMIRFEAGEPFSMVVPARRGELESFRPVSVAAACVPTRVEAFLRFSASRVAFVEGQKAKGTVADRDAWQRDYMLGRDADGGIAPQHQTRLRLAPFESL
jgi:hypothetical protein